LLAPELTLLKAFLKYEVWEKHSQGITSKDFPEELQVVFRAINAFHLTNENKVDLHILDLAVLVNVNEKNKEFYEGIFATLDGYEPKEDLVKGLIKKIKHGKILREISIEAYNVAEGKKELEDILPLFTSFSEEPENTQEDEFVTDDLCELVANTYSKPGLRWRLACLNRSLGSLRKGDFGFLFARPETGKTTFLASEVSFMAEQVPEDGGPILWFNNEEVGDKVKIRVYQASLGAELPQLMSNLQKAQDKFLSNTRGKVKIVRDLSYNNKYAIEKLCKKYKPSLIIFDQIDKINGFKADREDLLLGAIYQWARELAKQYCPVIGVCQADGSGHDKRWLTMNNVANAKTAKQAEADWILGIGCLEDDSWAAFRFLNISKNKLMGDEDSDPKQKHAKMEVFIEPHIARYRDYK
jgi:replicative DNA helicase